MSIVAQRRALMRESVRDCTRLASPGAGRLVLFQEPGDGLAVDGGEPRQLDRIEPPLAMLHLRHQILPYPQALPDFLLGQLGVEPGLPQALQHVLADRDGVHLGIT